MKSIVLFIGLLIFATSNANPVISDMIPIEPDLAKYLSSMKFSLEYGEVNHLEIPILQKFDFISTRLVALIEDFRGCFDTGTDVLPPLDPYNIESIGPIDVRQSGIITGTLNMQDIKTAGLKQFIIENMSFSMIGMTLKFAVRVPKIDIDAEYQLKSQIINFIPYNPSGHARLEIIDVSVYGFAGLGQTSDGFMKLSSFKVNFDFSYFNADIEGMVENELINKYFNIVLNQFATGVLNEQTDLISEVITETIRDSADEFIGQYRLADFLN